ncbi:MAG TPA: saccharopine dehydrogenase NADP-binding domain-containing protein [Polyangiaceae bacterium]|nr:saccharopine dehydrogenase NADP-binding domain-containing protein [Polyangiaceae bacterium]
MHRVLVLGGGKIGRMIACLLAPTGDYAVSVGDNDEAQLELLRQRVPGARPVRVDASDRAALASVMSEHDAVVSALSYARNPLVAELAAQAGASYFDLTEDRETTRRVREIAESARSDLVFMPQCGLAPGFVSVVANELTKSFDRLDKVFMRVGALPQFPSNFLKYNLTWSTDGLINEYCNPCEAIHEGVRREVLPLEGLEHFSVDGVRYEAFNTSGGLGSLCETFEGRVRDLNYKTIRYLGHREYMAFLLHELRMSQSRELLKSILESSIPVTFQDVVVVFCTVSGWRNGQLVQVSDARKIYNSTIEAQNWSAIQITTAAGVCVMVDLHFSGALGAKGLVRQEQIGLEAFLGNRFGQYYRSGTSSGFGLPATDFPGELR